MKLNIQGKILGSFLLVILCSFLIFNISIQRNIKTHFNQYCQKEFCNSCNVDQKKNRNGQIGIMNENQTSFLDAVQSSLLWTSLGTLVVALLLSILLSDKISKPIHEMIKATKDIAKGNYSKRLQVKGKDEIADLGNSLNEMAESLGKIEQLRKDLITNFSHEMATPLTTINGYMEAMEDGLVENDQKKRIMTTLKEETNRLISMIKDLRELSLLESGHFKIHLSPTPLYPMIEKIVQSMEILFSEKQIAISLDCDDKSPTILADKIRFPQIILNLLDNAYHYTPEGGKVSITICISSKSTAEITLADTGPGIKEKDLPHIFERFYRAESSRSKKSGGSGIGLSIVSDLMKLHNGHIAVESRVDIGTVFHLFFPLL